MQSLHVSPNRRVAVAEGGAIAGVAADTLIAAIIEGGPLAIVDASPVYRVPVAIVATRHGSRAGILTSLASSLVYDFLFTSPRFTAQAPCRRRAESGKIGAPRGGRRPGSFEAASSAWVGWAGGEPKGL